ncbi:glycosyltransferase family 4 protein [Geothrix campi]|uniref:glycosyltransferase family 4 protein n=1 Tax=Geothrix campi TaxID=2966450 RepID=UPI00214850E8|nr:glycosyltransferase family 4 protein [Geothrix sp. SG10]
MRIAVLGGAARDLVNFRGHLMSEMARAGHTVYGIAPEGTPEIQANLERLGVTYVPIDIHRTGLNPFRDLLSLFHLWSLFRRLRLDALLAYEIKAVVFGTLAAKQAGVPDRFAMITGRGTTLQGEATEFRQRTVRRVVKALYRLALRRCRGVLFQNEDDLAFFRTEGLLPKGMAARIVNGSGVDLDHFAPSPLPDGPATFLFVGRLLRDKGLHEYVQACRLVSGRQVAARFQILGPLDTNPNAITADQVQAWVQEGIVDYLGEMGDVRPALAAAHVLVLPSYGEGTPRSVLEAMSMGRAVVTTDAPGCRATVQEGCNGFLVPVRDSDALAEAIIRLAEDRDLILRLGKEGRKIAEEKYDVCHVTAEILAFMDLTPGTPRVSDRAASRPGTPHPPLPLPPI